MAYLYIDQIKAKRAALKAAFPPADGYKFSVTGGNSSSLTISMMQFPNSLNLPTYADVNHYYIDSSIERIGGSEAEISVFNKICEIAMDGHWDKSDIQTDYFHCAYYVQLRIGKWNKPAVAVQVKAS